MPALLEHASGETPQFQPMVLPGLGVIQPRTLTIASVHFEPRTRPDLHHSKHLKLELPAAAKGTYVTCTVCDSQQVVRNFYGDPTSAGTPEFVPLPVPVDLIAQSLIDAWCVAGIDSQMRPFPKPGIILLVGDKPTEAEMKQMIGMETALCRALVNEADQIEKTGKGTITDRHRAALKWLGSEKRSWLREIELGKTKRSPVTGQQINDSATVDDGVDLIEYYVKYNLKPEEYGDEHIAAMFKKDPGLRDRVAQRLGLRGNQQQGGK